MEDLMRFVIEDFPKKIEILMAEKDLTLGELAERSRLSRQNLYNIRRSNNPRPKTVKRIAQGLGVPVSYFYEE